MQSDCAEKIGNEVWYDIIQNGSCPLACTTFEYTGTIMNEKFYRQEPVDNAYRLTFYYVFDFSFSVTVHEEYLVHDFISMIGSVGGTLGMCIGFSFTGFSSSILNQILKILKR